MFIGEDRPNPAVELVTRRVLIADPQTHLARLAGEMLRSYGAAEVVIEGDGQIAMEIAEAMFPTLIITELTGPALDGLDLARRVRKSKSAFRHCPIIMTTAQATQTSIRAARDAGVHEFVRRPFSSAEMKRRIDTVATRPRPWVEGKAYVGPDRRRFNSGAYGKSGKRAADRENELSPDGMKRARERSLRILASALEKFENDPSRTIRSVREESWRLKGLALNAGDHQLAVAVGALEATLASAPATRSVLSPPIEALIALYPQAA